MNIILTLVFILLALLILWQWRAGQRARGMEGQSAPDTREVDDGVDSARKVYFFHAHHCRPCKSMMPVIDKLRQGNANLIKVELADHIDLARKFRIAGTPSFIVVDNGIIRSVRIGPVDEEWLRTQLEIS